MDLLAFTKSNELTLSALPAGFACAVFNNADAGKAEIIFDRVARRNLFETFCYLNRSSQRHCLSFIQAENFTKPRHMNINRNN